MIGLIGGACWRSLLLTNASLGLTTKKILFLLFWIVTFLFSHFVLALPRVGSDHTPLVVDTRSRKISSPKMFRFGKWWLSQPDFAQLAANVWNTDTHTYSAIENCQCNTRLLRKKIKGWSINIEAGVKKDHSLRSLTCLIFFLRKTPCLMLILIGKG